MAVNSSASERKVSNHIPNDLAFSVLSKLPLKSLKRFGIVNKAWSLLFQNPHFINKLCNNLVSNPHPYYNDTSLLLYHSYFHNNTSGCYFYILFGEKFNGERFENRVKLELPNPFQEETPDFCFFGCDVITGTLCLGSSSGTLILWNPTTHEFKVIPPCLNESVPPYREVSFAVHGFGYDHTNDDFKIIKYMYFTGISGRELRRLNVRKEDVPWDEISYEPVWEIYSLRCNSWKKLDINMPKIWNAGAGFEALCIDGICHWWSYSENRDEHLLVSFNLSNETFFTTTIPLDIPSDIYTDFCFMFVHRRLVVFNGSIASISWYGYDTTFHISILGELGVKESWTKLFVFGPLLNIEYIIGAGKTGDIFFRTKDRQLLCFDLSTQKTEEVSVTGKESNYYNVAIYKESLRSIGGINQ